MDATVEMFNMMQQWFQLTNEHLVSQDRKIDMLIQLMQKQTMLTVNNNNTVSAANVGDHAQAGQVAAGENQQTTNGG
jgi:hypothetical protein